jgi:hypothetical protein
MWENTNNLPQTLYMSDFHEEYHDLVNLLSLIMGLQMATFFQEWMFSFIEEIIYGVTNFHWAGMIIEKIHEKLMALKNTSTFYMTSYLVYLLAT